MRKLLPALTGVRYLLALHVVLFHFSPAFEKLPKAIGNFIGSGYVAVPMFFVLSGFVLTYTYGSSEQRTSFDRRRFWIARFARIYPVYLFAFLLIASYSLLPRPGEGAPNIFEPMAGVAQLFAVHTWVPSWSLSWNLPSWSIGVELFFYLVFPFFALRTLARLRTTKSLVSLILVMWMIGMSVPVLYTLLDPDGIGFLGSAGTDRAFLDGFWIKAVKFNPLFHLPEFVIGVAIGGIFLGDLRQNRRRNGAILTMAATASLLIVLTQSSHIPYPLLHNTTLAPVFAVLILGLAHGGGFIARCLSTRGFVRLGNASYAVYILQFPVAIPIFAANKELMVFPRIAAYLILLTILAILSERFIERPARRYLKRKLSPALSGPTRGGGAAATPHDELAELKAG